MEHYDIFIRYSRHDLENVKEVMAGIEQSTTARCWDGFRWHRKRYRQPHSIVDVCLKKINYYVHYENINRIPLSVFGRFVSIVR